MEKQTEVFEHMEFGTLEIVMIESRPYFPAIICAEMLGYRRPERAITRYCTGQVFISIPDAEDAQREIHIPEGDLYRLIIHSKRSTAASFEEWIGGKVFPSLRLSGACVSKEYADIILEKTGFHKYIGPTIQFFANFNAELQGEVKTWESKARYYEIILKGDSAVRVRVIAKDYGISVIEFNRLLNRLGIHFKLGKDWLLFPKYADMGYTLTRTRSENNTNTIVNTYWTQKGRLFLYDILGANGFWPQLEKNAEQGEKV